MLQLQVLPVRLEVILEVSRPRERAAAALEGAAQDLLGQRAAAASRRRRRRRRRRGQERRRGRLAPLRQLAVCVFT